MCEHSGYECLVVRTKSYYDDSLFIPYYGIFHIPAQRAKLAADYVDKNGVIRELALSYDEAMRIEI